MYFTYKINKERFLVLFLIIAQANILKIFFCPISYGRECALHCALLLQIHRPMQIIAPCFYKSNKGKYFLVQHYNRVIVLYYHPNDGK